MMPRFSMKTIVGFLIGVMVVVQPCLAALDASEVLVVYVPGTDGEDIATYYQQAHSLAANQLLPLAGAPTGEDISAADYLTHYRGPIDTYLNSPAGANVKCIVTTKGMPLRIEVEQPMPETYSGWRGQTPYFNYSMPVMQQILGGPTSANSPWKVYSSLESELTRIASIDTENEMGDQAYYLTKGNPTWGWAYMGQPHHQAANPLFHDGNMPASVPYDPSAHEGVLLTSRLDGYTTADVYGAIDRAQQAHLATIIVDDDPDAPATLEDRMVQLKVNTLDQSFQAHAFDSTDGAIVTAAAPVAGYVSHGVNDGAGGLNTGYVTDQLGFDLADGAVFFSYESYNAYSFEVGGSVAGQALLADWLAAGGTVGIGHVEEPFAASDFTTNVDVLFQALLDGYSWAEAAWLATPQLSYVNTVIGDPLMTLTRMPGDMNGDGLRTADDIDNLFANLSGDGIPAPDPRYDLDGDGDSDDDDVCYLLQVVLGTDYADYNLDQMINGTDLAVLSVNFGLTGSTGWASGDANGDGVTNGTDLSLLSANFGAGTGSSAPEPATLSLLGLGFVALLKRRL